MDAKGRIAIPAPFRRVLAEAMDDAAALPEMVIVYGDHLVNHCECYDARSFRHIEDGILRLPDGHPAREELELKVIGKSRTVTIDDTGRIVLPAKVKARAQLPDREAADVYAIGLGTKFRLWSQDIYDEVMGARTRAVVDKIPPDFNIMRLIDEPDAIDWT